MQIRTAINKDYPNLEWLTEQREVSLDRWFDHAADSIRRGRSDADARRILDNLIARFDDGHLLLRWPEEEPVRVQNVQSEATPTFPPTLASFCAVLGYDAGQVTAGTAASLPGYHAFDSGEPFRTGIINVNYRKVGVVRIGLFSPLGYPHLCERAVLAARIAINKPCDAVCRDRVLTKAYALMTYGLMTTIERLREAGTQVLLVDLTRNSGGSEWAEAAARIISPVPLHSAPIGVIRGKTWVNRWRDIATTLRNEAKESSLMDRPTLANFARRADAIADGLEPCFGATCSRLAQAGYASGLLPEWSAGQFRGKKWAQEVFNVAQFPYRDSVWRGPVIVLVDSKTWSAAEEFAALLRDNNAAIVLGIRTGGAGCGHLYGNDPIILLHSRAILEIPNCARFRRDGSNEVGGIVPDEPTGARWDDGAAYAGRLTAARLPQAIARAEALTLDNDQ